MPLSRPIIAVSCLIVGVVAGVAGAKSSYPPLEVLLSTSVSVLDQPIAYPTGTPKITAAIVTMLPKQTTGWHKHEVPLFAQILEGELTVDYGPHGTKVYKKDDVFVEAFKTRHNGTNTGTVPARILAVFAGSETVKNTIVEK
ncbi:MAG: cupin domain-containing protein [Sulfitobacter sp.]